MKKYFTISILVLTVFFLSNGCGQDESGKNKIVNPNGDSELALLMRDMFDDGMVYKAEMLEGISLTDSTNLTDLADIDLDASWLDIGDLMGGVLEGIGEFFAAILSSID